MDDTIKISRKTINHQIYKLKNDNLKFKKNSLFNFVLNNNEKKILNNYDSKSFIENSYQTNIIYRKYFLIQRILIFFIFFYLMFNILFVHNSYYIIHTYKTAMNTYTIFIFFFELIFSLIFIFLILINYQLKFILFIYKRFIYRHELFQKYYKKKLIGYILLLLVIPLPKIYSLNYFYNNNDIFISINDYIIIFRLVFFILIMVNYKLNITYWNNNRAMRIQNMLNIKNKNKLFLVKCLIKNNPFQVLLYFLFVYTFMFYKITDILENSYKNNDYNDYKNVIWNIFITMTSVGYGDISPQTYLGQVCFIIQGYLGLIIISIIMDIMNTKIKMTPEELKFFNLSKRVYYKKKIKKFSSKIIWMSMKYYFLKIGNMEDKSKIKHKKSKLLNDKINEIELSKTYINKNVEILPKNNSIKKNMVKSIINKGNELNKKSWFRWAINSNYKELIKYKDLYNSYINESNWEEMNIDKFNYLNARLNNTIDKISKLKK